MTRCRTMTRCKLCVTCVVHVPCPPDRQRRAQYEHRLQKLKAELAACEAQRLACIGTRAALAQSLTTAQKKLLELQAEYDRVALIRTGQVSLCSADLSAFTQTLHLRQLAGCTVHQSSLHLDKMLIPRRTVGYTLAAF